MTLTAALLRLSAAGKLARARRPGMVVDGQRETLAGSLHPEAEIDTTDPATQGCMLAQVREARDNPHCHVVPEDRSWFVYAPEQGVLSAGDTEGEALAAALIRLAGRLP